MIMSGQVSVVPNIKPTAQIETCTLSVAGFGEVLCTIYEDGMFQEKDITVNSDNSDNCPTIPNVVIGSLVVPMSSGSQYLASSTVDDALIPVYGTAPDNIFKIMGDSFMSVACFVRGTRISTGLRSAKAVEDITYEDMLLVWDFDNACLTYAKPCWIKKSEATTHYYNCVFSDGTELKVVGSDGKSHRLFNCDKQEFISATDCVGQVVMGLNGPVKLLSCDRVEELVEFYNVVTSKHMNLYANGMLASCRLNNLYPIQKMQYVKDDRAVVRKDAYGLVAQKYYDDLRLGERLPGDVDWINQYVERMDQRRV